MGGDMINFKRTHKSNRLMKVLTGLEIKQFNLLVALFENNLEIPFASIRKVNIKLG